MPNTITPAEAATAIHHLESAREILQRIGANVASEAIKREVFGHLQDRKITARIAELHAGNANVTQVHVLAGELTNELTILRDIMELARDRADNHQEDGKLVSLLDSAMPRMKRALDISVELEAAK